MLIIGCDFHPGFQQVAIFDNQTGEIQQRRLKHREEAEQFYRSLPAGALVGMEACGHYPWFERLLAECGHQLWLGDASRIRASVVRRRRRTGGMIKRRNAIRFSNRMPESQDPYSRLGSRNREEVLSRTFRVQYDAG